MSGYLWSDWRDGDDSSTVMSHTGVALVDGRVVSGAACQPHLVYRDKSGVIVDVVPIAGACELHDLTLADELLWVADPGFKVLGGRPDIEIRESEKGGQVFAVDLEGRRRRTIEQPVHDAYAGARWRPTAVAVDEASGDVWVTDGYGASLVHYYAADGRHVATLTGEEGAGRFDQPHDLLVDRRGPEPELLVADRVNGRVQVYDLDGRFRRVLGEGILAGPTQMALDGDRLVITDLLAGCVTILDASGGLVTQLFAHPSRPESWAVVPDEWPLVRGEDGLLTGAPLEPGVFLAPHGVAVDADGTIYVTEFAIGGRIAVLTPL